MNIFLYVSIGIYVIIDTFLMRRYENKIKELTEENKNLKKTIEECGE